MMVDPYWVPPFTTPVNATVRLPGSKSITNRAMLLAALCNGPVTLDGALFSEDTQIMGAALRDLGFSVIENSPKQSIHVEGRGGVVPAERADLFVGLAGTAARFLTALCAASSRGVYRIDGVPQMRHRPMKGLIDALRALGADIRCLDREGFFPLEIHARGLRGGRVEIDARESSQMLSALLMVAPLAQAPCHIKFGREIRWPFVHMTIDLLRRFGQNQFHAVPPPEPKLIVPNGQPFSFKGHFAIEADATTSSYFVALPVAVGGQSKVAILDYHLDKQLQGDVEFALKLELHGLIEGLHPRRSTQSISATPQPRGFEADFSAFSDTFLSLAAIAPLLEGETRITGIAHTRKQETDRVTAMATELRRLGQDVTEEHDALTIRPQPLTAGQTIETYGDHRFAMSFGVLGCHDLHGDGRPWLAIKNPGVCAKTFPDFFTVLENARQESARS